MIAFDMGSDHVGRFSRSRASYGLNIDFVRFKQGEIFLLVSEMIFIVNKSLCQGFIISFLFLETQLFLDLLS